MSEDIEPRLRAWLDKLEIRDILERYMRYNDDRAADEIAELFHEDARFQVMGRVHSGRVDGRWLIYTRTGVSLARPGEAGADTEWVRAIQRMSPEEKARLRLCEAARAKRDRSLTMKERER